MNAKIHFRMDCEIIKENKKKIHKSALSMRISLNVQTVSEWMNEFV